MQKILPHGVVTDLLCISLMAKSLMDLFLPKFQSIRTGNSLVACPSKRNVLQHFAVESVFHMSSTNIDGNRYPLNT